MTLIERRIKKQNLLLPKAPSPLGNYKAAIKTGSLLYISGQLPIVDGHVIYKGKLGENLIVEDGKKAAEICALNALSQLNLYLEDYSLIQIVKIEGYISAVHSFENHAQVLDGASNLFATILEQKSGHIRTVVGCTSLPFNVPVEISVIAELKSY